MFEDLAPGEVRRSLSAANLAVVREKQAEALAQGSLGQPVATVHSAAATHPPLTSSAGEHAQPLRAVDALLVTAAGSGIQAVESSLVAGSDHRLITTVSLGEGMVTQDTSILAPVRTEGVGIQPVARERVQGALFADLGNGRLDTLCEEADSTGLPTAAQPEAVQNAIPSGASPAGTADSAHPAGIPSVADRIDAATSLDVGSPAGLTDGRAAGIFSAFVEEESFLLTAALLTAGAGDVSALFTPTDQRGTSEPLIRSRNRIAPR
jgi:hypothetical protein